nr:MAG TPA: hypothetical protein [Caudoviricetes sp.]
MHYPLEWNQPLNDKGWNDMNRRLLTFLSSLLKKGNARCNELEQL